MNKFKTKIKNKAIFELQTKVFLNDIPYPYFILIFFCFINNYKNDVIH